MNYYATSAKHQRDKRSLITPEVYNALDVLNKVKNQLVVGSNQNSQIDERVLSQVNHDLNTLLSVLVNPVFQRICKIQDSVASLEEQLSRHPSCTTNDFDITSEGKLVLKISPDEKREPFDKTPLPQIPKLAEGPHGTHGTPPPITTPVYALEFEKVIQQSSLGREIHTIKLFKPEGSSLGFSVVGLKSQDKGELGIFVQEIQPYGIAARDGRLCESDQILAINDFALDSAITHQQAIGILQKAKGEVEIVVARALEPVLPTEAGQVIGLGPLGLPSTSPQRPSSPSEDSKSQEMVLNTEYSQVEAIHLVNDGTGLGFGIIGGRSTGVVVKTILPGGVADRQGHLKSGDHILQISDVNLWGMGSDQVAAVLRQCGSSVRLVVARPCEPNSPDSISSSALIVPTKILGDPEELERHLMQANGYGMGASFSDGRYDAMLPEVEIVDVELAKDAHGLGITIAGYVCEKEELSGIFVKSISEGSAADVSGKIYMNDRIIEVNGHSLQGFTNHEAVEVLRQTGDVVYLKLERYNYGQKYDQLQSAISHSEHKPPTPSSVSALSLPQPIDSDEGEEEEEMIGPCEEFDEEDEELVVETENRELDLEDLEILIDTRYEGEILPTVEAAIIAKWSRITGPDCDIVVAQISKGKDGGGLGISLEGTVDVEDGREVRPHHYIRSVLPDGPVGRSQKLASGDELLEVNGRRLLGLNHVEVVHILKDLPVDVRIVCARRPGHALPCPIDTSQDKNAFAARNLLGGSMQDLLLSQVSERLIKAKSDGSLASTDRTEVSLSKVKSRSLEPLTGLAMWSSDPHVIELFKGDRGLGFSILDYQDPLNAADTVIVIRSLVPGGVAQQDGRIIPGDRLLSVNEINLENASLDFAVQTLKAAPKGIVSIVVAKPLPLEGTTATPTTDEEDEVMEAPPPPLPISRPPEMEEEDAEMLSSTSSVPRDQVKTVAPAPVATERLITQSGLVGMRGTTQFYAAKQQQQPQQTRTPETCNIGAGNDEAPLSRRPPLDGEESTDPNRPPLKQFRSDSIEINGAKSPRNIGKQLELAVASSNSNITVSHESMNGKTPHTQSQPPPIEIQKRVVTHITIFPSPPSSAKEVSPMPLPPPPHSNEELELQLEPGPPIPPPKPTSVTLTAQEVTPAPTAFPLPPLQPPLESSASIELSSEEDKLPKMVVRESGTGEVTITEHKIATPTTSTDSGSGSGGGGSTEGSLLLAKHWGPEKLVEIYREPNKSLGISIVGGKVDLYNSGGGPDSQSPSAISGIFIKNVLPNSPAGKPGSFKMGSRSQGLCVGDMILEVNGISLRAASHEKAVDIIRAAGNPVRFLVQSLVQWTEGMGNSIDESEASRSSDTSHSQTGRSSQSRSQSQSTTSSCTSESTATNSDASTATASSSTYTTTRSRSQSVDGSTECYTSSTEESDKVTQKPRHETISEVDDGDDAENQELVEDEVEAKIQVSQDEMESTEKVLEKVVASPVTPIHHSPLPEVIKPELSDEEKQIIKDKLEAVVVEAAALDPNGVEEPPLLVREATPVVVDPTTSDSYSSEEDDQDGPLLQGRILTKAGTEIDRASAGARRRTKEEMGTDPETEDEFGYTSMKVEKRWSELTRNSENQVLLVDLVKTSSRSLGLSLAGHKDRNKMAVFICGINPHGEAHNRKLLKVGDEILECNGHLLYGRCHLNASALIKSLPQNHIKLIVLRKPNALSDLSVAPVVHFPISLETEKPEERYSSYRGLRVITLRKTGGGLGIMIMEGKHGELGQGIFISDIQEGSVAEQSGLFVGDMILAVNGMDFVGLDYEHAAGTLKKTEGNVTLIVCNAAKAKEEKAAEEQKELLKLLEDGSKPHEMDKPKLPPKPSKIPSPSKFVSLLRKSTSPTPPPPPNLNVLMMPNSQSAPPQPTTPIKSTIPSPTNVHSTTPSVSPTTSMNKFAGRGRHDDESNPATCEILPGKETTIEINKDRGLGISILGGQDTLLGSVIIQEVYPDGAAAKDGRLKSGDQLLYVNNENFQNITHSRALAALRQTPPRIKMVIYRDEVVVEEEMYDILEIELTKKSGKGLGLSIVSRKNGSGVFISDVVPGGAAEADGRLMKGDRILEVCGKDLKEASQEDAASVLKTAMGTILMKIGRFKVGLNKKLISSALPSSIDLRDTNSASFEKLGPNLNDTPSLASLASKSKSNGGGLLTNSSIIPSSPSSNIPSKLKKIVLEREEDGLGFSIVGGYGSQQGDLPIYIKTVFEKGAAAKEGTLRRGDQLMTINDRSLEGLFHQEVVEILKQAEGKVTLTVLP